MDNLVVFCTPLLLFSFWIILGYASLALLNTKRHTLQNLLLAPSIGLATNILIVFWLNRLGLGTIDFAISLFFFLMLSSIFIFWSYRPLFPKRYLFYILIFVFALSVNGYPLLQFGFNWLSFGNDDMANYCLRAMRYLHYGYMKLPNPTILTSGQDYSLSYWFWDALTSYRAGSELLLAWISALTKLNPLKLFMPVILSYLLCLISTTGALLYQSKKDGPLCLTTCFLLACSGLTTLGVVYQLFAQLIGITLFIGILNVTAHPFTLHRPHPVLRQSLLIGLLCSGFIICYPELIPFLGLSLLGYYSIRFCMGWKPRLEWWMIIFVSAFFILCFVNTHLIGLYFFIKIQALRGLNNIWNVIFPYFLSMNGIAYLWGLQVISKLPTHFMIFLGSILFIFTLGGTFKQFKAYLPLIITLQIMMFFALFLLKKQMGFALFKLAMYAQPFLIGGLALAIFQLIKLKKIRIILISLIAIFFLSTQYQYINYSKGKLGSPFVEMVNASSSHLVSELSNLKKKIGKTTHVIIDTPNQITAKLIALNLRKKSIVFYSKDFFYSSVISVNQFEFHYIKRIINPNTLEVANTLLKAIKTNLIPSRLLLHHIIPPMNTLVFNHPPHNPTGDTVLIISSPLRSILNRSKFKKNYKNNFAVLPWSNAINYLIFTDSNFGKEYYSPEFKPVSLYNLEPDFFDKTSSVAAIGRYLLFRLVNPTSPCRMILDFTKTFGSHNNMPLPHPVIIGSNKVSLSITGSGSARVYSSKVLPQWIDGIPYLLLDMGKPDNHETSPVMDSRTILAYVRNISLISENEYQHQHFLSQVKSFPQDLLNTTLTYSGLYEDGLISNHAYLVLHQPDPNSQLIIKGLIHDVQQKKTLLTVLIDQVVVKKAWLLPGEFELQISAPSKQIERKIELIFSNTYHLSKQDQRSIAGLLRYVGFESEKDYAALNSPISISHFPKDLANEELKSFNIAADGWIEHEAVIYLSQPKGKTALVFEGLIPQVGNHPFKTDFVMLLDKKTIFQTTLRPGFFKINIPMSDTKTNRKIELQFSNTQMLLHPDHRQTSALISFLGFKENT